MAHVGLANRVRIGIEETLEVPTCVRHIDDGVALLVEERPQLRERRHATGHAQAHPHDGDRFWSPAPGQGRGSFRRKRSDHQGGFPKRYREHVTKVGGELAGAGMVVHHGRSEGAPEGFLQPAPQLDCHERVKSLVEEPQVGLEALYPHQGGSSLANVLDNGPGLGLCRLSAERLHPGGSIPCIPLWCALGGRSCLRHAIEQRSRPGGRERRRKPGPVHIGNQDRGPAFPQGSFERMPRQFPRHRADPQPRKLLGSETVGEAIIEGAKRRGNRGQASS